MPDEVLRRQTLSEAIKAVIEAHPLDGVDIDDDDYYHTNNLVGYECRPISSSYGVSIGEKRPGSFDDNDLSKSKPFLKRVTIRVKNYVNYAKSKINITKSAATE